MPPYKKLHKNQKSCTQNTARFTRKIPNSQSIAVQAMQHWMNCVYSQTKFWAQFVRCIPRWWLAYEKSEIIIHSRAYSVAVAALISSAHSIKWWLERAWYGWYTFCCYFVYFVLVYGCRVCVCGCVLILCAHQCIQVHTTASCFTLTSTVSIYVLGIFTLFSLALSLFVRVRVSWSSNQAKEERVRESERARVRKSEWKTGLENSRSEWIPVILCGNC